ncbi:MAG TPA: glucoamylase family protein, partial [Flavisolibacter sp.]
QVVVDQGLVSATGAELSSNIQVTMITELDMSDKFPLISDSALVELVQRQTFKYFWDFGHPVSGLARERNSSGDLVTTGGSGFGVMAIVAGVHRNFITRAEGLARMQKIVGFLKNTAQTFKGAYPHWLSGTTGNVIPFSTKDNGADLVETSFLMMGLLTARQFFDGAGAEETALRNDINILWHGVQWSWFRQNNQNVLYWHWSPNYNWDMNHQLKGWNEALVTYVLAASSPTYSIPKIVYDNGWASNGGMVNGNTYYGYVLPLGPHLGGPLFFAHYSFLGINPVQLSDAYANYWTQNTNHTLINRAYCIANPGNFYGYSDSCWGLTASDDINGYRAHSPTNDNGVISPTAALSSFPYTPNESMKVLKFLYYKLGDKLWGPYGFYDAFSLHEPWFTTSTLAIDQGPIIVMMENYRSGLLWNLFMSCPEVKAGMLSLGFQSPNL